MTPTPKIKKIAVAVFAALAIALCSFTYSNKEGTEIPTAGEQIRTLNYRGHRYICYRFYETQYKIIGNSSHIAYGGCSIVHDPDCPCQHKK